MMALTGPNDDVVRREVLGLAQLWLQGAGHEEQLLRRRAGTVTSTILEA